MGDTSDDGFLSKEVHRRLRLRLLSSRKRPCALFIRIVATPRSDSALLPPWRWVPCTTRSHDHWRLARSNARVPGARGGACSARRVASAVPRRGRQARRARREGIYRTRRQQHSVLLCSYPHWDGRTQARPAAASRAHACARTRTGSIGSLRRPPSERLDAGQCPGEAWRASEARRSEPAQEGGREYSERPS